MNNYLHTLVKVSSDIKLENVFYHSVICLFLDTVHLSTQGSYFDGVQLTYFLLMLLALLLFYPKNHCLSTVMKIYTCFLLSFIVNNEYTFKSIMHFDLIFIYGVG